MKILNLLLAIILIPKVFAASATPSADLEIKDKIKQRLEINATQSALPTPSIPESEKETYYAWVGTLIKVDNDTLYIKTNQGEKQAKTDSKTKIVQTDKGVRKDVKVDNLKTGNLILAMGVLDTDLINAKRVVSTPTPQLVIKNLYFGKATEIEDDKITIGNGEKHTLSINKNTSVAIQGNSKPTIKDIQLEDRVFAIVTMKNDVIDQTDALLVIPGKNNPDKDKKDASPSASISE